MNVTGLIKELRKNNFSDDEIWENLKKKPTFIELIKEGEKYGLDEDFFQKKYLGQNEEVLTQEQSLFSEENKQNFKNYDPLSKENLQKGIESTKKIPGYIKKSFSEINPSFARGLVKSTAGPGELIDLLSQFSPISKENLEPYLGKYTDYFFPEQILPRTQDTERYLEILGLKEKKPETFSGRTFENIGELAGLGVPFGGANLLKNIIQNVSRAALPGLAGQITEEAGLGGLKPFVELGTQLKTGKPQKVGIETKKEAISKKIPNLSDKEKAILAHTSFPTVQTAIIEGIGRTTPALEKEFSKTGVSLKNKIIDVIEEPYKAFGQGKKAIQKTASQILDNAKQIMGETPINVSSRILDRIDAIDKKIVNSLPEILPDGKPREFLTNLLYETMESFIDKPTFENLITQFRKLNQSGNWGNSSLKESVIKEMKDFFVNSLKKTGSRGKEAAKYFEESNKIFEKFYAAENVYDHLSKNTTRNGLNFKKWLDSLSQPRIRKMYGDLIGTGKLQKIEEIGIEGEKLQKFFKNMKEGNIKDYVAGIAGLNPLSKGILENLLNPTEFLENIVKGGLRVGGTIASQIGIASAMFDPKIQNIYTNLMKTSKSILKNPKNFPAIQAFNRYSKQLEKELEKFNEETYEEEIEE